MALSVCLSPCLSVCLSELCSLISPTPLLLPVLLLVCAAQLSVYPSHSLYHLPIFLHDIFIVFIERVFFFAPLLSCLMSSFSFFIPSYPAFSISIVFHCTSSDTSHHSPVSSHPIVHCPLPSLSSSSFSSSACGCLRQGSANTCSRAL